MTDGSTDIVLSLISHTNIGKTTLTRTLLKADVGVVRDEAHVTDRSEVFVMLAKDRDRLLLWDTPGFGQINKLLKRLEQEGGALGWIMHEVIDRSTNRSLYFSLEAARNVRREADVVLYLVNVREHPRDAGYVHQELQLLEALGKPVIMLLNQIEEGHMEKEGHLTALIQSWQDHFKGFSRVKRVTPLDAFTRSWRQELKMMDLVSEYIPTHKQKALARLRSHFVQAQKTLFAACAAAAAGVYLFAARQAYRRTQQEKPKQLFERLVGELQVQLDAYLVVLMEKHGLAAEGNAAFGADVKQVNGLFANPIEEKKTGLLAGALTSAGSGLMADILSGGLTFGGGVLLGFLGGYLGGLSYAKLWNFVNQQGTIRWNEAALGQLVKLLLSYYLLAAFHGRGKGLVQLGQPAPFISKAVERFWPTVEKRVIKLIGEAVSLNDDADEKRWRGVFVERFEEMTEAVQQEFYPGF